MSTSPLDARCPWCLGDPLYEAYHDTEWGVPLYDDQRMFEFLILESFQAGLSWLTILRKRESFRAAFDDFDAQKIYKYTPQDHARLMSDAGIIRNRLKIGAAIHNAQSYLDLLDSGTTLCDFFWDYVDGTPIQHRLTSMADAPAQTLLSTRIAQNLKKKGFKFVGPTTTYAHMQACGMVNDHLISCPRHANVQKLIR